MEADEGPGRNAVKVMGITALVLALLACFAVIGVLAFSVRVDGHSMEPTLRPGDRLFVQLWGHKGVRRFDVVEAHVEVSKGGFENVVKRVVGLPGDSVSVVVVGNRAEVRVTPAGSATSYRVDSRTWSRSMTGKVDPCCGSDGRRTPTATSVKVPAGSYWLVGDNWGGSDDSRTYGFIRSADILGKLNVRILPLGRAGDVGNPARLVPLGR